MRAGIIVATVRRVGDAEATVSDLFLRLSSCSHSLFWALDSRVSIFRSGFSDLESRFSVLMFECSSSFFCLIQLSVVFCFVFFFLPSCSSSSLAVMIFSFSSSYCSSSLLLLLLSSPRSSPLPALLLLFLFFSLFFSRSIHLLLFRSCKLFQVKNLPARILLLFFSAFSSS